MGVIFGPSKEIFCHQKYWMPFINSTVLDSNFYLLCPNLVYVFLEMHLLLDAEKSSSGFICKENVNYDVYSATIIKLSGSMPTRLHL